MTTGGANPGGPAETRTLSLSYSWPQEPSGYQRLVCFCCAVSYIHYYCRTAQVAIPATAAGQKVPVVFHLHGKPCVDNIYNVDMPAEYSIHYRQAMAARATPDLLATS